MTAMPHPAGGSQPSAPSGYEILDRLLAELRARGRTETLERWAANAAANLQQMREQAGANERLLGEIERVEKAYYEAIELVRLLRLYEIQNQPPPGPYLSSPGKKG